MIVAAAVCPAAPWLLPGVARHLLERATAVSRACTAAVEALHGVDGVVAVVPARRPAGHAEPGRTPPTSGEPDPVATSRLTVTRSDRGRGPVLDLGPAVAAHLLAAAGWDHGYELVAVAGPADDPEPVSGGATVPSSVGDPGMQVGLLVLADGAAAHGPSAPGRADPRADQLDAALAAALDAGDPVALAAATDPAAEPAPAGLLARVQGLRLLADWTRSRPPRRASLLTREAPFGVGQLVALWDWRAAGPGDRLSDRGPR